MSYRGNRGACMCHTDGDDGDGVMVKADTLQVNDSWLGRWRLIPPRSPSQSIMFRGKPTLLFVCVCVQLGVFNSFPLLLQTNNVKWNGVTLRGDTHSSTHSRVDSLF